MEDEHLDTVQFDGTLWPKASDTVLCSVCLVATRLWSLYL
jgi:hypothetical protein